MDNKVEKMIIASRFKLSPDTVNTMLKDAEQLDKYSWAKKYEPVFISNKNLAVDWKREGMDKFSKDKYERYQDAFGMDDKKNPFDKPEEWMQATWQSDFSDIPREEFMSDIANMSKYWQDYKAEGDKKAGIEQRKREIEKNWSLPKKMLASDYSKNRYIYEPEKSIFSDEGEWFNKGEDVRDVSLGLLGLAGDFVPGVGGVFVGPAARATRDIVHKAENSPYQKDWSEVGRDVVSDLGLNYGAYKTANLRKADRLSEDLVPSKTDAVIKAEEDAATVQKQLGQLGNFNRFNFDKAGTTDADLFDIVKNMPDTELKSELLPVVSEFKWKPINRAHVDEIARKYQDALHPNVQKAAAEDMAKGYPPGGKETPDLLIEQARAPKYNDLNWKEKIALYGKSVLNEANKGKLGQVIFQVGKRAAIDPSVNTDDERLLKDWYKQNYARDWLLEKPFKPKEDPKDLKWQAYVELRKENNLEP